MFGIETGCGPKRQTHTMKAKGVVSAKRLKCSEWRPATEIILGMDFKPAERGPSRGDLADMRRPETYPDRRRNSSEIVCILFHEPPRSLQTITLSE